MKAKSLHVIIEGARGLGKSTVTSKLRQLNTETVLINHTGLNGDNPVVKSRMTDYYEKAVDYMESTKDIGFTYIHDRFIQSEAVMSRLYKKNYTFDDVYERLMKRLDGIGVPILLIYLDNNNTEEIERNLENSERKEKAHLFNRKELADNVNTTTQQLEAYRRLYTEGKQVTYKNILPMQLDVSGKTVDEVVSEVQREIDRLK